MISMAPFECSRTYEYYIIFISQVDHLFKHRINSSVVHASNYLKQFPSPIISIIAKFISFVSGGFAAVLIIIAFLEESLLEGHVIYRNLHHHMCPPLPSYLPFKFFSVSIFLVGKYCGFNSTYLDILF